MARGREEDPARRKIGGIIKRKVNERERAE